jgi:hypothetical protein
LGRLGYTAQALYYEKAFLGMIYMWTAAAANAHSTILHIPWAIQLVLTWIRLRLLEVMESQTSNNAPGVGRLQPVPRIEHAQTEWFRTDAKAQDGRCFIGGWELDHTGSTDNARWYAMEIRESEAPWVFAKKDPQRVIAALELLATLVAIVLFDPEEKVGGLRGCTITASTDNKGNSYIISKLSSTKWPITALLIETSEQLRCRSAILNLQWLRRENNSEADALTNQDFKLFKPELRIGGLFSDIKWKRLDSIIQVSQQLYKQITEQRSQTTAAPTAKPLQKHKKKSRGLKWTNPW